MAPSNAIITLTLPEITDERNVAIKRVLNFIFLATYEFSIEIILPGNIMIPITLSIVISSGFLYISAIKGEPINNNIYIAKDSNTLKISTDEKSKSSALNFCISAEAKPFCTRTFAIVVNIKTIATVPYSEGLKSLARSTDTIN